MSEPFRIRSPVGSRSSAFSSHLQHHHHPHPRQDPDPLTSTWIRRLHLTARPPTPPPALPRRAPARAPQDAVSTDESRTPPPPPMRWAGFGPFRWNPRPLRDPPVGAWDGGFGGAPGVSPFFRLHPAAEVADADLGEFAAVRPPVVVGDGVGGMFPGLPRRMVVTGDPGDAWLAPRDIGAAYLSHPVDMAPIRTPHVFREVITEKKSTATKRNEDAILKVISGGSSGSWFDKNVLQDFHLHDIHHSVMPQHFTTQAPSSSIQHDEPFSYWNMGRFQRNTTTSSVSPVTVAPGNLGKRRNPASNSLLPLKFRKLSGAI